MRRWWLLAPVPLLLGFAAWLLLLAEASTSPVFYLRSDIGTLCLLLGGALSFGLSAIAAIIWWVGKAHGQTLDHVRLQIADERRRFLRRLDHELKNPLTAIRAGLVNLSGGSATPAQTDTVSGIESQVVRISRLVADLRKVAELEIQPIEQTPVDMAHLLTDAVSIAQDRPEAAERSLSLILPQAPWPLRLVSGDQDLLFLAVHNLIDNALKYTLPGNTIEVRAFEDGTAVVIEVADTGPGIPAAETSLVWEELYRGHNGRDVPGSGLGLALVHAIAERHNGQASVRSRPGHGTVFSLRLPLG